MPTYQITGPDGKSYRITGDNPEGAFQALQQHLGSNQQAQEADPRDSFMGKVDSAMRGAADTLSFGLADEIAAGGDALLNPILGTGQEGGSLSERYAKNLEAQRGVDKADSEDRFGYRLGGQLAGGVAGGLGLAKAGLSPTAAAIERGAGLGRVAAVSAGEGAALGAAQGFGSGEGLEDRAKQAGIGFTLGAGIGGATPLAVSALQKAGSMAAAPALAPFFPDAYANKALAEALRRSGKSAEEIAAALEAARVDGQDMFNVADAMGNAGQRMLSGVTRTPNDARQIIAEALIGRQMDQGRRVAASLQDASGTPWTASKYEDVLKGLRSAEADKLYAPVRADTSAIDVSPAVDVANKAISPTAEVLANAKGAVPTDLAVRSGVEAGEASIRDPIRQAMKEARSYLASDTLTVTNVDKAFRAKTNIDQMIASAAEQGRGGVVDALTPMRDALDDALANTSKEYAAARDAYRAASQNIDAIGAGREMARPRTRVADNLDRFASMTPEQQQAARVGYFDPAIGRAENTVGSMTNSARPFISDSARRELPVMAAPGEGARLMNRLGREQRMFETTAAALGGSKTADNLADLADVGRFDPSVIMKLGRGDFVGAVMDGIRMAGKTATGAPPSVVKKIGEALMQTDPQAAKDLLSGGLKKLSRTDQLKAQIAAALISGGSAGAGRLAP